MVGSSSSHGKFLKKNFIDITPFLLKNGMKENKALFTLFNKNTPKTIRKIKIDIIITVHL